MSISATDLRNAQWIWDGGERAPRNAWRLFRRVFSIDDPGGTASLSITADAAYVLFVNGDRVGQGPARGFPHRYFVDSWDVLPYLHPGQPNVIAVQVIHHGVATFQHLMRQGGLIACLEFGDRAVVTDSSWRVESPAGLEPRTHRMSCQLGFVERVDLAAFPANWTAPAFDDSHWEYAIEIGGVGCEPWPSLQWRDIPPLHEESRSAERLVACSAVQPLAESRVVDLRTAFDSDAPTHANQIAYSGYLFCLLHVDEAAPVSIVFGWGNCEGCVLDGEWISTHDMTIGPDFHLSFSRKLSPGPHLLAVEFSRMDHGHGFRIALDGPATFLSVGETGGEFALLGPLGEPTAHPSGFLDPAPIDPEIRNSVVTSTILGKVPNEIRTVPWQLVSPVDFYTVNTWGERMPLELTDHVLPVTHEGSDDVTTELIFDLGREMSGFVEVEYEAHHGAIIDLFGFEYFAEGHRENPSLLDTSIRLIATEGRQRYQSPTRRGMRYVQVRVTSNDPWTLHRVGMVESHFPLVSCGSFACSDPVLDRIYEISRNSVIACMEDTWVDCPAFEQTYWVGDAFNTSRFATWLFGAEELTARCLRLAADSASVNPMIVSQVPSGWDNILPNWTFFWIMTIREHWRRTGDTAIVNELLPTVSDAISAFAEYRNECGLLEISAWNLLDWAEIEQPNDGVVAHQNVIFVLALRAAAELANAVERREEASQWQQQATALAEAIDRELWDDQHSAYIDAIAPDGTRSASISQHVQMLSLLASIPKGSRRALLEHHIVNPPDGWVQIGTPWMSAFMFEILADMGRTSDALASIREHYGDMLSHDATTCWETYPTSSFVAGTGRLTRSHCHAWSAAPASFLPKHILGIHPQDIGWQTILIKPEPCGLAWAEGSVPLPSGELLHIRWKVVDDDLQLDVMPPPGVNIVTEGVPNRFCDYAHAE